MILIIAAIAIPNYIQSKMRSNEASAAQNLRNISTAEILYSSTYGINFSTNLLQLSGTGINPDQNNAGTVDSTPGQAGAKSGIRHHLFTLRLTTDAESPGTPSPHSLTADPQSATTGQRHFYTDQTCVIRVNTSVQAGPTDLPM